MPCLRWILASLLLVVASPSFAQHYPNRPVRVVVWRDRARVDATVVPQKMPE